MTTAAPTRAGNEPRAPGPTSPLEGAHPAVRAWFEARFPEAPLPPQRVAWPLIAGGDHVLVASPTGTGKTLTGFLMAIDAAYRAHAAGTPRSGMPEVVYVSPLRALAVDIHENLQVPLAGIAEQASSLGLEVPSLRIAVRTGDTPAAERAAMRRSPPDLLVTTPESLYLLLTAESSRSVLGQVRTVIVDEAHTLARDKRGAHLALSLERLEHVVAEGGGRLQRIGLSATQRPLDVVARLLCGVDPGRRAPAIVDCGHRRDLDIAIELPSAELEAVAPQGQFSEVLDRIADLVRAHRTTLVFVNTRKLAERVAHQLAERLSEDGGFSEDGGPDHAGGSDPSAGTGLQVAAHHGSLSFERRRAIEARLRAGQLRALVRPASLELGIDVGPVELVCQIGSPRSIATFLQRVGRANHQLHEHPAGRLFPLTRDELVECTAPLVAVREGRLDLLSPPVAPSTSLPSSWSQRWLPVASGPRTGCSSSCAGRRRSPTSTGRPSTRWSSSCRAGFRQVGAVGAPTCTGNGVHGVLRPRRGARLAALTGGGAIPETGDYRVVLDPDGVTVGSLHEDFAVEANIGDIFLLGTHSWRVKQVETGIVRVHDAGDAPPTVPFWLGEAPARTRELSEEVGTLRAAVEEPLAAGAPGAADAAREFVRRRAGVSRAAADQVVAYLAAGRASLGALPTNDRLIVERFFDDAEGSQLVIHSPYGGRINRALGLALRKRLCVSFDFELQAAADDDTVVLSLGPQHSFPLSQVPSMLSSRHALDLLTQAVLTHPMLQARWRWNLTRSLVVPRSRGGRRRPIHLQRMESDDLLAAAWPSLAACQDNAAPGPTNVPDQVLVRQTVADCLTEPLDGEGLVSLLRAVEAGRVEMRFVESAEPSPLAHGILSGRPYTFLDGAPLEERRTRAVPLRRSLGVPGPDGLPVPADELASLDGLAVEEVLAQIAPRPRRRRGGPRPAALTCRLSADPGVAGVVRPVGRRGEDDDSRRLLGGHRAFGDGSVHCG